MYTLPKLEDLDPKGVADALDEVKKLHADLVAIDDDQMTDEQLDELEALAAASTTIVAHQAEVEATAAARAERIAAAKAAVVEPEAEPEVVTDPAIEAEVAATEIPDNAAELEPEPTAVVASATPRKSVSRQVAAAAPAPQKQVTVPERPKASIVSTGENTGYGLGSSLDSMKDVAKAFLARTRSMPQRKLASGAFQRHSVASFQKATTPEFTLVQGDQEGNFERIHKAAVDQGAGGNLVAAGGWCAPSETIYDIPQLATVSGVLSIAEVNMPRGGISFTKGPSFEQIYADSGFLQTETQAEAGEVKNFIDVECPGFEEVRLDAIGFGVRASILTNKAWPELVRHYLDEVLVAHAHKKNASIINRIVALSGSPITAGAIGSVAADALDALSLQATRLRYKYRLGETARIEGFAPQWLLEVMRSDFAYREGLDVLNVTAAQVNSWLAARNIYLQWVLDWQDLSGNPFATGTSGAAAPWPTSAKVELYPAGAFVAGTEDVISLDIVHDTASLSVNTFTAAFFEEALAVFNPKANGVIVELAVPRPAGRIGAANLTNGFVARPAISA